MRKAFVSLSYPLADMGRCAFRSSKLQVTRATNCKLAQACVVPRQPSGYLTSYKSQINSSKFQTRTERVGKCKSAHIQHTTTEVKDPPLREVEFPSFAALTACRRG